MRRAHARKAGRNGGDAARAERRARWLPRGAATQSPATVYSIANNTGMAHAVDYPHTDAIDAKDEAPLAVPVRASSAHRRTDVVGEARVLGIECVRRNEPKGPRAFCTAFRTRRWHRAHSLDWCRFAIMPPSVTYSDKFFKLPAWTWSGSIK